MEFAVDHLFMQKIVLGSILLMSLLPFLASAQNIGVGGSGIYNFQTTGVGAGARVSIYPARQLSIVPQGSYYFGFNKVHEFYIGLGLEYKLLRTMRFNIYAIGHGAYNHWLNPGVSGLDGASPANWNLEGGLGISTIGWIRPFLEYRYNIRFQETHLQLGLLYIFGRRKNPGACPAF